MPAETPGRRGGVVALGESAAVNQNLNGVTAVPIVSTEPANGTTAAEVGDAPTAGATTAGSNYTSGVSGGYSNTNAYNWNAKSRSGFVGLSNQGATCYLNSLVQSLFMTPELRMGIYRWVYDAARYEAVGECIPAQLQRLFVLLQVRDLPTSCWRVDLRSLTVLPTVFPTDKRGPRRRDHRSAPPSPPSCLHLWWHGAPRARIPFKGRG